MKLSFWHIVYVDALKVKLGSSILTLLICKQKFHLCVSSGTKVSQHWTDKFLCGGGLKEILCKERHQAS